MKRIQQFLLSSNEIILFLLVAFPVTFNYYSNNNLTLTRIVDGTQVIGGTLYLIWINGICRQGTKTVSDADSKNLKSEYVTIATVAIIFAFLAALIENMTTFQYQGDFEDYNLSFTISEPIWIPIVFYGANLYLIYHASRVLTELKSGKLKVKEMAVNVISFLILLIGIFFIQPKVKKELKPEPNRVDGSAPD